MTQLSLKPKQITLIDSAASLSADTLVHEASKRAGQWLSETDQLLATVESCTGGGIAFAITHAAGSSAWFERGFVTYTNQAKHEQVGVDLKLIQQYGAVSEQVAAAMAEGGLQHSSATISVSVTGIAGPGGGSMTKPVGMVCFGRAQGKSVMTTTCHFNGDRDAVRHQSILFVLNDWLRQGSG